MSLYPLFESTSSHFFVFSSTDMATQEALSIVVANLWTECLFNVLSLRTPVKRGPRDSCLCWDFCSAIITQLLFSCHTRDRRFYLGDSQLESHLIILRELCWEVLFETGLSVLPNGFDGCYTSGPFVVPFLSSVTLDQIFWSSFRCISVSYMVLRAWGGFCSRLLMKVLTVEHLQR